MGSKEVGSLREREREREEAEEEKEEEEEEGKTRNKTDCMSFSYISIYKRRHKFLYIVSKRGYTVHTEDFDIIHT